MSKRRFRPWGGAVALLPFLVASCGSILGIEDPTERDGGNVPVTDAAPDGALDGTAECVCPAPQNATAHCGMDPTRACVLGACNAGFGDCDNDPKDGCEAQLSTTASCGDCATDCTATGKKYCTPQGGGRYTCTDTCLPPNAVCGTQCVDPATDAKNCGNCSTDCTLPNGTGTCVTRQCHVVCLANFCPPSCVSNDLMCAGNNCMPCPAGTKCGPTGCVANTCTEGNTTCGVMCNVNCTMPPAGGPNFTCDTLAHACSCPMTHDACGSSCVACASSETCSGGNCVGVSTLCGPGEITCAGVCVPKDVSPNCGTCLTSCTGTAGMECCSSGMAMVGLPLTSPVPGDGLYSCMMAPAVDAGTCKP